MTSPTSIVAYLALFAGVGFLFLFANLVVGKLLRPKAPNVEKLEVYECGEPTIGSSFVQFDLRFYVVALLFIIFDVEIAFFFPWATVFGKSAELMDLKLPVVAQQQSSDTGPRLTPEASALYRELGVSNPTMPAGGEGAVRESARTLAWMSLLDIGVFFAVLLVGFAYVWKRGDLDWVRAVSRERALEAERGPPLTEQESVLTF